MKKNMIIVIVFVIFIFLFVNISGETNKYYELKLMYNNKNISLNSVEMKFSSKKIENYNGEYIAKTFDFYENELNSNNFIIPNEILYDEINKNGTIVSGGSVKLNKTNFTIHIPYHENASEILIYNENMTEKLRINVYKYSKLERKTLNKLINNKTKDKNNYPENQSTEDKEKYPNKDEQLSTKDIFQKYWWVLVVILLILLFILIRSLKNK